MTWAAVRPPPTGASVVVDLGAVVEVFGAVVEVGFFTVVEGAGGAVVGDVARVAGVVVVGARRVVVVSTRENDGEGEEGRETARSEDSWEAVGVGSELHEERPETSARTRMAETAVFLERECVFFIT